MKAKLVAFVAVVTVTALLGGCATARNGLGTRVSACFRVYPEAVAAVHGHGRFAGERYLPPRALIIELHGVVVPDALQDASRVATCLVAFTGRFTTSDVEQGWAPMGSPGRIAIVIVRQRDLVLLATVVLNRIPPHLVFARVFPRLR
ncbi:MAG: hypothetical protein ABSA65_09380 [Acidimicrobiales bacterium]|jgi:hypothetical protein